MMVVNMSLLNKTAWELARKQAGGSKGSKKFFGWALRQCYKRIKEQLSMLMDIPILSKFKPLIMKEKTMKFHCYAKTGVLNINTNSRDPGFVSPIFGKGFKEEYWGPGVVSHYNAGEKMRGDIHARDTGYWWVGERENDGVFNRIFLGDDAPKNGEIIGNFCFLLEPLQECQYE